MVNLGKILSMKPHLFFTAFALFVSCCLYSQKIYITQNKNEADYKIFIAKDKSNADWVVMKTTSKNQAKIGRWFFTNWKNEADIIVYISKDKSDADKIVYFTEWTTDVKFKK